jgi:hypothetical protein
MTPDPIPRLIAEMREWVGGDATKHPCAAFADNGYDCHGCCHCSWSETSHRVWRWADQLAAALDPQGKQQQPTCTQDPNTCAVGFCDFPRCLHDSDAAQESPEDVAREFLAAGADEAYLLTPNEIIPVPHPAADQLLALETRLRAFYGQLDSEDVRTFDHDELLAIADELNLIAKPITVVKAGSGRH